MGTIADPAVTARDTGAPLSRAFRPRGCDDGLKTAHDRVRYMSAYPAWDQPSAPIRGTNATSSRYS
jgi:hypothetical protein